MVPVNTRVLHHLRLGSPWVIAPSLRSTVGVILPAQTSNDYG
jgi:hypothetical protein